MIKLFKSRKSACFRCVCAGLSALAVMATYQAQAKVIKHAEQVTLVFANDQVVLQPEHVKALRLLVESMSSRCLSSPSGSLIVAIEAVISEGASPDIRAVASARAQGAKKMLEGLGVPAYSVFDDLSTVQEISSRKVAAGVSADEVRVDSVTVELICDPLPNNPASH